jgi:hypothetical protein
VGFFAVLNFENSMLPYCNNLEKPKNLVYNKWAKKPKLHPDNFHG